MQGLRRGRETRCNRAVRAGVDASLQTPARKIHCSGDPLQVRLRKNRIRHPNSVEAGSPRRFSGPDPADRRLPVTRSRR